MKHFLYLLPILICTSCKKFLEVDLNKSLVPTEKVFSNDVTATAAVTAIYYSLVANSSLNGSASGMASLSALSAGELFNYSQYPEYIAFQDHQLRPDNLYVEQFWKDIYNVIYQADAVLEGLHQSTGVSRATAQQLEGEALFIRAYAYFYLVNLFGDVPLTTETNYRKNQLLRRQPVDDVYAMVTADLLSAQTLLSKDYVTPQRARPNKATATALLACVYLYRKEYAKAAEQASAIIGDANYQLTAKDDIDKTFLIDSKETIWQIMPGFPWANTQEANSLIVTSTPYYHIASDALRGHFEGGDLRAGHWISSFTNTLGTYYFPYKYKQKEKVTKDPFTEASIVFRLAETYLIRAEARAQLDDIAGAQSDLNAIRTRAGIPALTGTIDQATMRSLIQRERCIELAYEGHRFFDLRRWKIATQPEGRQGGDFFGMNVFVGTGLSDPAFYVRTRTSTRVWYDRYYFLPIPQSEVQKNLKMVQTFGY